MRPLRVVFALAFTACGLFPDLSVLSGNDAATDATTDDVMDASAYADVRLNCQERPCVVQTGETCCWFSAATDTCVAADACTGFGDLACFGAIECLAVGQTTCCATGGKSVCTDLATCQNVGGKVLCDRNVDASSTFGSAADNGCPGSLACTGTTTFNGYAWRTCQ